MRPGRIDLSDLFLIHNLETDTYFGQWYDYSGQEYLHVTEAWLAARLQERTNIKWNIKIFSTGNGRYCAEAAQKTEAVGDPPDEEILASRLKLEQEKADVEIQFELSLRSIARRLGQLRDTCPHNEEKWQGAILRCIACGFPKSYREGC